MMISPESFIKEYENLPYSELLPVRDELIEAVRAFEEHSYDPEEELVEESIRIAASLCRKMILCSQITGLSVNTDPPAFLEPGRGRELLSRIEYLLTDDFTARGTSDFIKLFDLPPKRQTSPVINIENTKNLRETEFQESNIQGVFVKPVREDGKIASHIFVRS